MTIPSPKTVLETWSALIGVAGSTWLDLMLDLDAGSAAAADAMQWPMLIVGTAGAGSMLVSSCRTRRGRM